jgi:hypothetical protein
MGHEEPRQGKTTTHWRKILGGGASLALMIFILVGVTPKFASYSSAWARLSHLGGGPWVAIA